MVEVGRMSPNPNHGIDAARAADDFSARPVNGSSRGSCLRRRAIRPINIRCEVGWPQDRALQGGSAKVIATGFDQQHATGAVFGKARCDRAAGRTSTNNNVVVGGGDAAPTEASRRGSSKCLIRHCCGEYWFYSNGCSQMQEPPPIDLTGRGASAEAGQTLLLFISFAQHGHGPVRHSVPRGQSDSPPGPSVDLFAAPVRAPGPARKCDGTTCPL